MVRSNSKVIVIDGARKRAIAVVFPGTRSAIVVGHNDEIQVIRHHIGQVFHAEVPDTLEIAPCGVRMKIADHREMRKIIQKLVDSSRRAIVPLHTAVTALCSLI